eukprot:342506-Hanusia_phi.AAC.2
MGRCRQIGKTRIGLSLRCKREKGTSNRTSNEEEQEELGGQGRLRRRGGGVKGRGGRLGRGRQGRLQGEREEKKVNKEVENEKRGGWVGRELTRIQGGKAACIGCTFSTRRRPTSHL